MGVEVEGGGGDEARKGGWVEGEEGRQNGEEGPASLFPPFVVGEKEELPERQK